MRNYNGTSRESKKSESNTPKSRRHVNENSNDYDIKNKDFAYENNPTKWKCTEISKVNDNTIKNAGTEVLVYNIFLPISGL